MDVNKTFLNGDFEGKVYMEQLEGFISPEQEYKVCKLMRSLYGLKQAPKNWHEKFRSVMLDNVYIANGGDMSYSTNSDLVLDHGEADVILGIKIIRFQLKIVIT
ncbi:hypothetical protein RJ639_012252 [Escallonia herrerae]|uniref:Reverse transcriptase Ty1/copia-type domain-containing protein n=1 Tax=Escallonia herrerae TaxID=1293975 RepID=A0AA89AS31_9ASTE|nr:hypothetical protein RJ639_012252 [Escallonia herrerae]